MMDEPDNKMAATYEVHYDDKMPKTKVDLLEVGLVIAGILIALGVGILGQLHENNVSSAQSAQIHALDSSNTRLARELATDNNQLSQMSAKLAAMGAKVTATDPASDSSLITCGDLRRMDLTATTGGSVSSVPGNVNLSQAPVPLPAHCPR
jgi:hypothetical protein